VNSTPYLLRLLGAPRLEGPLGVVSGPAAQRHRLALLALLSVAPGGLLPRDRVMALLWPETSPALARQLLNAAVHSIRKALGAAVLVTEGRAIRLDPSTVLIDVLEFERHVEEGNVRSAVDLYSGPFCDGLFLPEAVEFEQWQQHEAARLEQLYWTALEQLAARTEDEHGTGESLRWWRQRLACTPTNGRIALEVMRVLAELGDRPGALRVAVTHAALLNEEFGIAPDAHVEAFAADLKHSQQGVVRVGPADRPAAITTDGREPLPGKSGTTDRKAVASPQRRWFWPTTGAAVASLVVAAGALAYLAWHTSMIESTPVLPIPNTPGDSGQEYAAAEPAAHEAWVRARFHLQRRAESDLETCLAYANEATRIDPDFAPAYAVKAACHFNTTYLGTTPPAEAFFQTKLAARRALALDERHAGAHVALAWALAAYDLDWDGAERNFARAIELNPGFDYGRTDRAFFLAWLGRHEEAEAEARHALTISPVVPVVAQAAAQVSYLARRYDEAIVRSNYTQQLDSTYYLGYQRLGFAYSAKGMHGEAVAALQQAVRLAPHDLRQRAFLGYMYAQAGQLEEANSVLIRLLESSRHTYVPPTSIAILHLGLGQHEAAIEWLEKGFEDRDGDIVLLKVWPVLDPIRGESRFERLLRRMNFPCCPNSDPRH
jgi:DNA-binding SARP family transcriptional activator/Flp pilus assembly protein TadD